jgi:hypothetical protein
MSNSIGNFSSITIGKDIINSFNADGSYNINGNGTFGVLNAKSFEGPSFIIGDKNANQDILPIGILKGGGGHFFGLDIDQIGSTSGNLIFSGNNLSQGVVFGDKSFLNTADNINNLTGNITYFNSINLKGNIIGNDTSAVFNTIDCLNTATFNNINSNSVNSVNVTGNNGQFNSLKVNNNYIFPLIKSNNANINNIYGNNINDIQNISFNNNTIQSSAPGFIINGNMPNNLNTTDNNASLKLPAGRWFISFNINFTDTNLSNNITVTSKNDVDIKTLYNYPAILLPNNSNSISSGSYIYQQTVETTINLVPSVNSIINPTLSHHTAIRLNTLTSERELIEKTIMTELISEKNSESMLMNIINTKLLNENLISDAIAESKIIDDIKDKYNSAISAVEDEAKKNAAKIKDAGLKAKAEFDKLKTDTETFFKNISYANDGIRGADALKRTGALDLVKSNGIKYGEIALKESSYIANKALIDSANAYDKSIADLKKAYNTAKELRLL